MFRYVSRVIFISVFMIDWADEIRHREFPDTLYALHNTSLFGILSTDRFSCPSKPKILDTFLVFLVILEDKLKNLTALSKRFLKRIPRY
jgi:hypothetical protein